MKYYSMLPFINCAIQQGNLLPDFRHLLTKEKNLDLLCLVLCVVTCLPNHHLKEISSLYHSVFEIFAFLGCCAAQRQRISPIFRGLGRTDTLSKNIGGISTYAMQQLRKQKFSPSKRFTTHHFLEGIPTTGEGQNLRDVLCSTQDVRLIVTLILKLLRVWMGVRSYHPNLHFKFTFQNSCVWYVRQDYK